MQQYLDLMQKIVDHGESRGDRTGTGTISLFGEHLEFDLQKGFPLLTTKKLYIKGIVYELMWFLNGLGNNDWLRERGVHIWDEWAHEETGEVGPIYGVQWRHWDGIDQITQVIQSIRKNPYSRRHIVSAWNVLDLPYEHLSPQKNVELGLMSLAPCHVMFQFYVHVDGRLSCQMYQRSADYFLGVPFNIASYAFLTHIIAQQTNLTPGWLKITFGDVHLYKNHLTDDIVFEQLKREPRELPTLELKHKAHFQLYDLEDFVLHGYKPHPTIKAPISV